MPRWRPARGGSRKMRQLLGTRSTPSCCLRRNTVEDARAIKRHPSTSRSGAHHRFALRLQPLQSYRAALASMPSVVASSAPFHARSWSLEGALKLKNLAGYADIWDASIAYGWDQTSEVGVGVSLPRFKSIPTPLMARASLLSQDWLKFSSYKEHLLGLSFVCLLSAVLTESSFAS